MKTFSMSITLTVALVVMSIGDFLPNSPLRVGFVKNAEAIIGMPWTPFSYAGVARRSMYREAAWNAAAMNAAAINAANYNAAAANSAAASAAAANAAAANAAASAAAAPEICGSCRADRHNGAEPTLWLQLYGDQWRQLF